MRRYLLTVSLALAVGCTGFNMRKGEGGGLPNPDGTYPGQVGDREDPTIIGNPLGHQSRRTVCRSTGIPRGWVAVDYLADGQNCGGTSREPYSAMVIQLLTPLPVGTYLTVCQGQKIPVDWRREDTDIETGGSQCPRNPGERHSGPTVMTITRLR